MLVLDHPIAGLQADEISQRVAHALPALTELLARASRADGPAQDDPALPALSLAEDDVPDDPDAFLGYLVKLGISDGLPAVAPTPARVSRMLGDFGPSASQTLGLMPPRYGRVTAQAVAICAVMAGCLPAYLPVVIATIRALLQPEFNLNAIQTTTHCCSPLAIVSGPAAARIGMNSGGNAFGAGNRANATIGRAVRLSLIAIGGAIPGDADMATLGSPAKYSFAVAENVAQSPWGSLAASRGFDGDANCVTVIGAEAPHNINDHESTTALGILRMIVGTMRNTGMNNNYYDSDVLLVLSPEHAASIARDGFSRKDVQRYVYENARTPIGYFSDANVENRLRRKFPKDFAEFGPRAAVPVVRDPANVLVGVVGGPGKHSMFVPTFGVTRAVTLAFDAAPGPIG